jgi:hypothetical protein
MREKWSNDYDIIKQGLSEEDLDISKWKTYRSEKTKTEFLYPNPWSVGEIDTLDSSGSFEYQIRSPYYVAYDGSQERSSIPLLLEIRYRPNPKNLAVEAALLEEGKRIGFDYTKFKYKKISLGQYDAIRYPLIDFRSGELPFSTYIIIKLPDKRFVHFVYPFRNKDESMEKALHRLVENFRYLP